MNQFYACYFLDIKTISNFQDEVLADGKVVIDLIDAIKPGSINYDLVLPGANEEVILKLLLFQA